MGAFEMSTHPWCRREPFRKDRGTRLRCTRSDVVLNLRGVWLFPAGSRPRPSPVLLSGGRRQSAPKNAHSIPTICAMTAGTGSCQMRGKACECASILNSRRAAGSSRAGRWADALARLKLFKPYPPLGTHLTLTVHPNTHSKQCTAGARGANTQRAWSGRTRRTVARIAKS